MRTGVISTWFFTVESVFSTGKSLFKDIKCIFYPGILRRGLLIYKKCSTWIWTIVPLPLKFLGVIGTWKTGVPGRKPGQILGNSAQWQHLWQCGVSPCLSPPRVLSDSLEIVAICPGESLSHSHCGCAPENQHRKRHSCPADPSTINCCQKGDHIFSTNYWFMGLSTKLIST